MHVMNCRVSSRDEPDWLAFDLDLTSGRFGDAARAGLLVREILESFGMRSYPKTSGGRGLHVLVPLQPGADQATVRAFAMEIGRRLAERSPRLVTTEMSKRNRRGRVFADALRNAFGQTDRGAVFGPSSREGPGLDLDAARLARGGSGARSNGLQYPHDPAATRARGSLGRLLEATPAPAAGFRALQGRVRRSQCCG